jgi:hypothetical protein
MAHKLRTKTRSKRAQKKQQTQGTRLLASPGKDHIPYHILRNQLLELAHEDLIAIAEADQQSSPFRFTADLPEEDDDESYEPEEEEYLSDDWDIPLAEGFVDDQFSAAEAPAPLSIVPSTHTPLPAVVVDREYDATGVKLAVHLANAATLRTLMSTWHQAGQHDRADLLGQRLQWLVDAARYIVAQQQEFFLQQGPRRPLGAIDVARSLWPEENVQNTKSRISYLLNNKALLAPWGEVIALPDLLPSTADCLLEHICRILREHDHIEEIDGRLVARSVIQVDSQTEDSIVKQLQRYWQHWLGHTDGLSPENVKHVMKRNNIPRVAGERKVAYEQGKAWWITRS